MLLGPMISSLIYRKKQACLKFVGVERASMSIINIKKQSPIYPVRFEQMIFWILHCKKCVSLKIGSTRKYIDVNDTMGFTDAPDRGIGGFGLAGKKSMCFHVANRFTRIFLRYTVHMHVEEEFQNLIPGFRTN